MSKKNNSAKTENLNLKSSAKDIKQVFGSITKKEFVKHYKNLQLSARNITNKDMSKYLKSVNVENKKDAKLLKQLLIQSEKNTQCKRKNGKVESKRTKTKI